MDAKAFVDLLQAREGLVAAVGAGGKKSTLYRLVEAHLALGTRPIGLTATVQLGWPPAVRLPAEPLVAGPAELNEMVPRTASKGHLVIFAGTPTKPGRLAGLAPEVVASLHQRSGFAVTLVKADGARMRSIKAPAEDEPVLPQGVATVLASVSARAIGHPLDPRIAHRVERIATAIGIAPGEVLTAVHVGRLLASPRGALQGVGESRVVPIINMVEVERLEVAREAARHALAATERFDRVVLASMTATEPVIEVVCR
jgi:probable selenium-dependent hydroxylase accessory protein YqeC